MKGWGIDQQKKLFNGVNQYAYFMEDHRRRTGYRGAVL